MQKQELLIQSVVAEENCELVYNEIFCANVKLIRDLIEVRLDLDKC
jgi:hypothetical protein